VLMSEKHFVIALLALFLVVLALGPTTVLSEVHTWTDEHGKKHFGDTIPPKYADKAQKLELNDTNMIDPEPEVEKINRRYRAELQRQYQEKQRAKEQSMQSGPSPIPVQAPAGPESCWKRFPHGSEQKARTMCLKSFE